jgi:acyl-CoA synthetase (AMP-forming)/AMP-acid ligase II
VVDVPDEIARQVPVAIVNNQADKEVDISDIRGTLTEKFEPWFALEDIISVEDIGMDDFPKTSSGKTQKNILRENFV